MRGTLYEAKSVFDAFLKKIPSIHGLYGHSGKNDYDSTDA